jgi:uncharacterized protein YbcI
MAATDYLRGGELNAALTKALVRIQREHLDRGPANAIAFHGDDVVIVVMHDVLTKAEKILAQNGSDADVGKLRHCSGRGWKATSATPSSD